MEGGPNVNAFTVFNYIAVTIGFERTMYMDEEGNVIEVCAVLTEGTLERNAVVVASSNDDTATGTDI